MRIFRHWRNGRVCTGAARSASRYEARGRWSAESRYQARVTASSASSYQARSGRCSEAPAGCFLAAPAVDRLGPDPVRTRA
jgi:hypothetical protein